MTNSELKEWIKRQLGYPTRNVELTDEQLDDIIKFSLNEVQPWFTTYHYLTLDLISKVIDLSEYNIYEVMDVIKVIDSNKSSDIYNDPFSYPYSVGLAVGANYMNNTQYISRITNSDIHHVISAYAKQYNELFYTRVAQLLQMRSIGTINPTINYKYDRISKTLYIDPGYPNCSIITIEYIPYLSSLDMLRDERYIRCAQDLALGQAMIVLSRVVQKFDVSNAPARVSYDYLSEGKELVERTREELKRISRRHIIID